MPVNVIAEHLDDFTALFYPRLCASCGQAMRKGEEVICTFCQHYLPRTSYHLERYNPVEKHFWGRTKLFRAASFFYFQRGSRIQHLIHQLKYRGKVEIGIRIGELYGMELAQNEDFQTVDVILPVPLHKSKEMQRGYNQSDLFCEGLSNSLKKPWMKNVLVRVRKTETQTHKTRFERWENVETVFKVADPDSLAGKHVLIADDVITTGSTLEACAEAILRIPGTTVSVVTIACAFK